MEGILVMAHAFARQDDTTPEEALREELMRSVGGVRWLDGKVGSAISDDELLPDGRLGKYVEMRLKERAHLLRVATAGVTVGLSERLVTQAEGMGAAIAGLLGRVLAEAELSLDDEGRLREMLAREMRMLGA